jgi:molybdopterin synthase catalytic subunit
MGYTRIQHEAFHIDPVIAELTTPRTGGVNAYVGTVRADDDGRTVDALTYESFPEMAQPQLERLRQQTIQRFSLEDATIIHRIGTLKPGEPILLVALAGRHRKETYHAIDWFMDELKQRIPIWKKEDAPQGSTWILGPQNQRLNP